VRETVKTVLMACTGLACASRSPSTASVWKLVPAQIDGSLRFAQHDSCFIHQYARAYVYHQVRALPVVRRMVDRAHDVVPAQSAVARGERRGRGKLLQPCHQRRVLVVHGDRHFDLLDTSVVLHRVAPRVMLRNRALMRLTCLSIMQWEDGTCPKVLRTKCATLSRRQNGRQEGNRPGRTSARASALLSSSSWNTARDASKNWRAPAS
jgi:hypothetical protein